MSENKGFLRTRSPVQDWVRPFIWAETTKHFKRTMVRKKKKTDENFLELLADNISTDEGVYGVIAGFMKHHFGHTSDYGEKESLFTKVFGSVLANLPKHVFLVLFEMKNLYFLFSPNAGVSVKDLIVFEDIKEGDYIQIVFFPYHLILMPIDAVRGQIVHEFAHLYAGHTDLGKQRDSGVEDVADELAMSWGFGVEINALRNYGRI